jgi:hypothetical protein
MSNILDAALAAYESGNEEDTEKLVNDAIARLPEAEGIVLRLLRARAYEFGGYPGGVDLSKAYVEYRAVEDWTPSIGSEALVGAARVLFDLDAEENKDEIMRLCVKAVRVDRHVHAKMLLGLLHDKILHDRKSARKWYFSAYMGGLPWGLRYCARLHTKDGNYIRAFFFHALTSITSPFLVMLNGAQGPFSEHP